MSKKRNRKSHSKKRKKQKQLKWYEKAYGAVISFFDQIKKSLKNLTLPRDFFVKNRLAIIFSVSMALIVAIGYFTFVYETPEEKAERINETISVDLSDTEDYLNVADDIEEVANATKNQNNTTSQSIDQGETHEIVEAETTLEADALASEEMTLKVDEDSEESLAIEKPSADMITEPLTFITEVESEYEQVSDSMMVGIDMFAIIVDDEEVAYFETEEEANNVLELLKDSYRSEEASEERIIFAEDVVIERVKQDIFDVTECKTPEEILEFIVKGTNEQKTYNVVSGDNAWDIAHANGLRVDELESANPHIENIAKLQIGDRLSLIVPEPIINVVTISTVERIDPIPYGRDPYVKTDNYYEGEYKTKRAGVEGKKDVVVEVYSKNGKIIGEKELSATVLEEPINQVVWQGTKPPPPRIGTGTFDEPTTRGYITSYFGSRSLGWHNGIDIGLPMNTDVYAADGGVVIYADYKGTYGKVVIINHGENKETRYAHLNVIKVSPGQNVHKGQLIALSGNTGRSTGPHLHFEVRINNVPVNPTKYVNY